MPTSVAYIGTGQIMGWGNKAIEVRYLLLDPWIIILMDFLPPFSDTFRWERPFGWCVHAQKGAALEIPLRAQRQSILQQCQRCFIVSNLLYDAQQTGHGQLVIQSNPIDVRWSMILAGSLRSTPQRSICSTGNKTKQNNPINIFFLFYHTSKTKKKVSKANT